MQEICANYLLSKALKGYPKCKKLPNLVTLPVRDEGTDLKPGSVL